MPLAVLERQIRALPEAAQMEVAHYVGYLYSLYNAKPQRDGVTEKVNAFLKENPAAFDEFARESEAGIEAIRELTKNDSW